MKRTSPEPPLWLTAHALFVFAFLYLPIAILILYSFNGQGVGGFPPRDLTLNWYRILFNDGAIWDSVLNSLLVAAAAMLIALLFGIPAALALDRAQFPGKALFRRLVLSTADSPWHHHRPVVINAIQSSRSKPKLANHHVRSRHRADLRSHHRSLRRTAETKPRPGRSLARLRGDLLANLLAHHRPQPQALDRRSSPSDLHLIHGRNSRKLLPDRPRQHVAARNLGRLRRGITPEINAISTIIFLFSLIAIVFWYHLRTRAEGTPEIGSELVEAELLKTARTSSKLSS